MTSADAAPNFQRRSIAGRLLFWFLVIALIPCGLLTAITARIASTALEHSVRDTLVHVAAAKAQAEVARTELKRAERLLAAQAVSQEEFESRRSAALVTEAATQFVSFTPLTVVV